MAQVRGPIWTIETATTVPLERACCPRSDGKLWHNALKSIGPRTVGARSTVEGTPATIPLQAKRTACILSVYTLLEVDAWALRGFFVPEIVRRFGCRSNFD